MILTVSHTNVLDLYILHHNHFVISYCWEQFAIFPYQDSISDHQCAQFRSHIRGLVLIMQGPTSIGRYSISKNCVPYLLILPRNGGLACQTTTFLSMAFSRSNPYNVFQIYCMYHYFSLHFSPSLCLGLCLSIHQSHFVFFSLSQFYVPHQTAATARMSQ